MAGQAQMNGGEGLTNNPQDDLAQVIINQFISSAPCHMNEGRPCVTRAYPVVVVGAGVAGLRCAQELQSHGVPVIVVEALDRIGG